MGKRLTAMLLCTAMAASILSGCTNEDPASSSPDPSSASNSHTVEDLLEMVDNVEDSSAMPDWEGETLTLRVWNGHGTGDARRDTSSNDVVRPELERIFGIKIDAENSFDNGGQDLPSKMAVLAATNDWPELGQNVMNQDLVDSGKLYDLTELLPKYAPHYYAMLQKASPRSISSGWNGTGKLYNVASFNNTVEAITTLYDDVDMDKYKYIAIPEERLGVNTQVYVRDDILKLAYPEAKTQDEIEELYLKNGEFTREELYDVPITSKEEAFEFFYKIKEVIDENNITENGKPVYATYAFSGQDNWALLAGLESGINGIPNVDYFTFFNVQTKKIDVLFKQDFFKEDMLRFNKFVRDGVASEASLIENNEIFTNKLNNGEYAISYAWLIPDNAKLEAAGKPYRYRKVYFDIEQNTSLGLNEKEEINMSSGGISIFKDMVKEEDLPRVLAFLDYFYTDAGMNLVTWGPRSAGLFEEKDGVRQYTDKELEACMVYGEQNNAELKYNLAGSAVDRQFCGAYLVLELGIRSGGLKNPRYIYDLTQQERQAGSASNFFSSGLFDQQIKSEGVFKSSHIWNFTNEVEDIKRFWDVRGTGFEPMMTKVLAAKSNAEFEEAYNNMVQYAEENGLTDEALEACNQLMQEKYPEDWAALQGGFKK